MTATYTVTAAKPVYNSKTKTYDVDVVRDVHNLGGMIHAGYVVYDDAARVLAEMREGRTFSHLTGGKRDAILAHLTDEAAARFNAAFAAAGI